MVAPLRIGIAGLGTVGAETFRILLEKSALVEARAGKPLEVVAVSARSKNKQRNISLENVTWYDDALALAADKNVDVVVELIGGENGVAQELCKKALQNKKHVVTANKALIAHHGVALAKIAEKNNVKLLFEASVAGGIPVLKALREGLAANNVTRVAGILNGTCNYILTAMELDKRSYDDVLKEAQDLGYAEADPSFDVDGIDTTHKLSILTALAFGVPPNTKTMHVEGIRRINLTDIRYAHDLGYRIRLLGIARLTERGIEQRVHPALVPLNEPLARVEGVLNAVEFDTDSLGSLFLEGAGAGAGPTASAVVADLIDIAAGRGGLPFGVETSRLQPAPFVGIDNHVGEYYVRLTVQDKPGVLAGITKVLGSEQIGMESVIQPPSKDVGVASIILQTHEISERTLRKALNKIAKLEYVQEEPHIIRIEDL